MTLNAAEAVLINPLHLMGYLALALDRLHPLDCNPHRSPCIYCLHRSPSGTIATSPTPQNIVSTDRYWDGLQTSDRSHLRVQHLGAEPDKEFMQVVKERKDTSGILEVRSSNPLLGCN